MMTNSSFRENLFYFLSVFQHFELVLPRVESEFDQMNQNMLISDPASVLNSSSSNPEFLAFYSSVFGGITTDPRYMVLPIDDHMCHRGHAVFDTCNIKSGKAYGLDFHLERFLNSCKLAHITPRINQEDMHNIILHTIAASQRTDDIFCRFWMSAGRGNFGVSSIGLTEGPTFYVMVHHYPGKKQLKSCGVREYVVNVPLKPPLLATVKSTNYLLNALCAEESQRKGGYLGIQLHEDGTVAEGAIGNIGMISKDNILITPPFGTILSGTTVKKLIALVNEASSEKGQKEPEYKIAECRQEPIHLADLIDNSLCVFSIGGGSMVPICHINDIPINNGEVPPIFSYLYELLEGDMLKNHIDDIPYSLYGEN